MEVNRTFTAGNKLFGVCKRCRSIVRLDGFFGGRHICELDEPEVPIKLKGPVKGKFTSLGTSTDGMMESGYVILGSP